MGFFRRSPPKFAVYEPITMRQDGGNIILSVGPTETVLSPWDIIPLVDRLLSVRDAAIAFQAQRPVKPAA